MTSNNKINNHRVDKIHPNEKVSVGTKVGYAFGDFGANFQFQSVSIFLMFYFTDVFKIGVAAAGMIFLISKIWDAVSDPLVGYAADRVTTRWGQKRPFLLFGSIPLGITLFLLYAAPPIESPTLKIIYATFTFLAVLTFYTLVNVPYSAMTANLTLDSRERSSLTAYRMVGAILGTLVVATATRPLVACFSDEVIGFRAMGAIYGFCITFFTLITFFSVKERVRTHCEKQKGGLIEIYKVIFKNPPLILLLFGIFFHYAAHFIFLASVAYFFKYCFGRVDFISIGFFCLYVPAILMLPILVHVSKKYSKKIMFNGGMFLFALGLFGMFFIKTFDMTYFVIFYIISGLGISAVYQGPWSIIPDTVEFSEWKTGLRREGIIYGVFFFGMKLSAGFSAFLVGFILNLGGYIPDVTQAETSLSTIRFVTTLLPGICFVIGAIFIFLYPINRKRHMILIKSIVKKNKKQKKHI